MATTLPLPPLEQPEGCVYWDVDHCTNPECPQRTASGGCIYCDEVA